MVSPPTSAPPARVLLVTLNSCDHPHPVYPFDAGYIDGALRERGHRTEIWDACVSEETIEACLVRVQPDLVALSTRNIDNVQYHKPNSFIHDLIA